MYGPVTRKIRFTQAACISFVLVFFPIFHPQYQVKAQGKILSQPVVYIFGKEIIFKAKLETNTPVAKAQVLYKKQGESKTVVESLRMGQDGSMEYRYDLASPDPGVRPPRAFSKVIYWFEVVFKNGENITSPEESFDYVDNRFDWHVKETIPFRVHWYSGDDAFAQRILDAATEGLQRIQNTILPLEMTGKIDIYAYSSSGDMQPAEIAGKDWVAGQAAPDLNIMLVSLPPNSFETRLDIRRRIPHELMHILLFQNFSNRSENLPVWLNEGLASMAELNPNPDYQTIIEHAIKNKSLIPLSSLCQSFPTEISSALLSYAEAHYFTFYLYSHYGSSGLQTLTTKYSDGLDCQTGFETTFGISLDRLESKWLEDTFGRNLMTDVLGNLLPWIVLFFLIVAVPLVIAFGGMKSGRKVSPGNL